MFCGRTRALKALRKHAQWDKLKVHDGGTGQSQNRTGLHFHHALLTSDLLSSESCCSLRVSCVMLRDLSSSHVTLVLHHSVSTCTELLAPDWLIGFLMSSGTGVLYLSRSLVDSCGVWARGREVTGSW